MTYYTTKCPHCGSIIKFFTPFVSSSGSPFKVCPKCGKEFIDPDCHEQALKPYKKSSKTSYVFSALFGGLLVSFVPFIFIAYFSEDYKMAGIIAAALFVIGYVFFLVRSLARYEEIEKKILEDWQASHRRLSNPRYAQALKQAGFDVPKQYLEKQENENDDYIS